MKDRKHILLNLNSKDLNVIEQKAKEFKTNKTAVIRILIRSDEHHSALKILKDTMKINKEILYQIRKIGTNINQIALYLNIKRLKAKQLEKEDIEELQEILKDFKERNKESKLLFNQFENLAESIKDINEKRYLAMSRI